jgi:cell division protein FtsB
MKRFVINTIFILILLSLIAGTIVGKRGFIHLMKLEEEYQQIDICNQKLKQENEKLKTEIADLKNNLRYLEEVSRNELGFAKKGELIYRTEKKK